MKAIVTQSTGSWYIVKSKENGQIYHCRIKGKFRMQDLRTTNPIAVGDCVHCEAENGQDTWIITHIEPRRNYIIRTSPHSRRQRHIIASNLDQLLIIATLVLPRTSTGFIDRLLLNAEMYGIPALIVFNKHDIYDEETLEYLSEIVTSYQKIGYPVLFTSAINGYGTEELKQVMKGKTTLISGHSGVGKSSLINYICPNLFLPTNQIAASTGKGQHTTTFATMYDLDGLDACLIDTPGIKEFGIAGIEPNEVAHFFPEFRALLSQCRFSNCSHREEPDCAIHVAVRNGDIAAWRYQSYLSLVGDAENINYWERDK